MSETCNTLRRERMKNKRQRKNKPRMWHTYMGKINIRTFRFDTRNLQHTTPHTHTFVIFALVKNKFLWMRIVRVCTRKSFRQKVTCSHQAVLQKKVSPSSSLSFWTSTRVLYSASFHFSWTALLLCNRRTLAKCTERGGKLKQKTTQATIYDVLWAHEPNRNVFFSVRVFPSSVFALN